MKTTEEIEQRILKHIAEVADICPGSIRRNMKFTDLGLDSLDKSELFTWIENDFDICLYGYETVTRIDELISRVEELCKK